jgi:hypothetical protein
MATITQAVRKPLLRNKMRKTPDFIGVTQPLALCHLSYSGTLIALVAATYAEVHDLRRIQSRLPWRCKVERETIPYRGRGLKSWSPGSGLGAP